MEWGIATVRDAIEVAAILLATTSVVVAATSYFNSRKQLQFGVMTACVARYQELAPALRTDMPCSDDDTWAYLDLCNEELFYFKHGYLRDEVALEWVDGMIHYVPLLKPTGGGEIVSWQGDSPLTSCEQILADFPRLRYAFESSEPPPDDMEDPARRRPAVQEVVRRARKYAY